MDKTDWCTHALTVTLETIQDQAVNSARGDERGFTLAEELLAIDVHWEKGCYVF